MENKAYMREREVEVGMDKVWASRVMRRRGRLVHTGDDACC
jgi:hypothetical protein